MPGKRFGVFRLGESPGDWPAAVFQERWLALLAAAVLPGTGRDAAFRLQVALERAGAILDERVS